MLALASALLLALAQPPFHVAGLPFLALVPLAVALGGVGEAGGRESAWTGLVFGVAHWSPLLIWIPLVVAPRFPWAYAGFGALVGILGGLSALLGWTVHRLRAHARLPLALAFSLGWVVVEWLKVHFPFGLSWPWLGLGVSLAARPELLGLAEWVGEAGVGFWLALVNGLVAAGVMALRDEGRPRGRTAGLWLLAAALAVGPSLVGWARARTLPLEAGPRVAVVGTEVAPDLRLQPLASAQAALVQVRSALEGLRPGEVDLIVLPEGTVPLPWGDPQATPFLEELGALAARLEAPILLGALGSDPGMLVGPGLGAVTNSAVLLTASGTTGYRYDKRRLVPGMEWGGYLPGEDPLPLFLGRWGFGPLICYESLFGAAAREHRMRGAQVLVNLTSDVWFGEGASLPGRLFLEQHPAHLVLRAVENRVSVARAANGGASLLLDPRGRSLQEVAPNGVGLALATLPLLADPPLFTRTGDLVGPAALLLVLLLLSPLAGARGGRRPKAERVPDVQR